MAEEMKLETKELDDVEIFEAGVWKGHKYTENDIDEMVKNFKEGVAEPYITIDHSNKATSQFKDALQALALGFVKTLERRGSKLIAGFKQVPKTIAELIESGPLKKKSIEFYRQFIANGKPYKNVLQGVTFHGANGFPEVNTLSDFLTLYKSNLQTMDTTNKDIVSLKNADKEAKKMSVENKIELKNDEYQELLKKASHNNVLQDTNDSQAETITNLKSDSVEIMKENEELKLKQDKIEKAEKESLNKEADEYISKKINDGIIQAPFKDRYVSEYITYKTDKKDMFESFIADIDGRGKVINLTPSKNIVSQGETNFKYNPDELDFKVGSTINYEELEANVQAIMKAKNITWEAASIECNAITSEEIGKEEVAK